jgi:hypothetical protein
LLLVLGKEEAGAAVIDDIFDLLWASRWHRCRW